MTDDTEISWHREQIAKNRTLLEELEACNTTGGEVFPETQSEIEHLKAQRNRLRPIALLSDGRNLGPRRTQSENHADHGDSSASVGRFDCARTERQHRRYDHIR
jgi:hypothetical protein